MSSRFWNCVGRTNVDTGSGSSVVLTESSLLPASIHRIHIFFVLESIDQGGESGGDTEVCDDRN